MDITGKTIIIIGLGKSGMASAAFALGQGAQVAVYDSADLAFNRSLEELAQSGAQVVLGAMPEQEVLDAADIIILSPGVPHDKHEFMQAAAAGTEITGELEFAARFIHTPIIGITGTNGKTTTTELCASMLKAAGYKVFTGGNIGTPLIEYAMTDQTADVCVVEVSSFQLDTSRLFRPQIAVILNVTPDHLDRYAGDLKRYGFSKMRIFANQAPGDFAILNIDDAFLRGYKRVLSAQTLWFGDLAKHAGTKHRYGAQLPAQDIMRLEINRQLFELDTSQFKLIGPHNRENLAAAALAALAFGADVASIEKALAAFAISPHRLALVAKKNGVRFIDDSKATNIDAVARALDCVESRCVLIMGGLDKGCDFTALRPGIKDKVRAIVAIGAAQQKIVDEFSGLTRVETAASMQAAVQKAYALAKPDDSVLLSPACASFDMFESYAQRGNEFIKAVEAL